MNKICLEPIKEIYLKDSEDQIIKLQKLKFQIGNFISKDNNGETMRKFSKNLIVFLDGNRYLSKCKRCVYNQEIEFIEFKKMMYNLKKKQPMQYLMEKI